MRKVIASITFLMALAWVVRALHAPHVEEGTTCQERLVYRLEPGASIEFTIAAGAEPLKVFSAMVLTLDESSDPDKFFAYALRVTWVDGEGHDVDERLWHERTRPRRLVGGGVPWADSSSRELLAQSRLTTLDPTSVQAMGGRVRIVAEGEHALFLRLYRRSVRATLKQERVAAAPTAREMQRLSDLSGVEAFDMLTVRERLGLVRHTWASIPPRGRNGADYFAQHALICSDRLTTSEQRAAKQHLGPQRSQAHNLVGPVRVRLAGTAGFEDVRIEAIAAPLTDGTKPQVSEWPKSPLPVPGAVEGRELQIDFPAPFSLVVSNPLSHAVSYWVAIPNGQRQHVFGDPSVAQLARIYPRAARELPDTLMMGTERHHLMAYGVGGEFALWPHWSLSGFSERDAIRVVARPIYPGLDAVRPYEIWVDGLRGESVVWSQRMVLDAVVSPFERLRDLRHTRGQHSSFGESAWVGEPTRRFATAGLGADTLRIRSVDPVAVAVSVLGAEEGRTDQYPLPNEEAVIRYPKDGVTSWHALVANNDEDLRVREQTVTIDTNTRIEYVVSDVHDEVLASYARDYESVDPLSENVYARGRTYLMRPPLEMDAKSQPVERSNTPLAYYCVVGPAEEVQLSEGLHVSDVELTLWSPRTGVGKMFDVFADDVAIYGGRIAQVVTRLQRMPLRVHTLRAELPVGTKMFMRREAFEPPCEAALLPKRAYPVAPGDAVDFRVSKVEKEQLLVVGGFAEFSVPITIDIDGGRPALARGLHISRVVPRRHVRLELADPPVLAQVLALPFAEFASLQAQGLLLSANLPNGTHTITVRNEGEDMFWVRVALERVGARREGVAPRARWIGEDDR